MGLKQGGSGIPHPGPGGAHIVEQISHNAVGENPVLKGSLPLLEGDNSSGATQPAVQG